MRLDRLSIPNYRNLRSFEIDFDESQPTTVLLGRNGSGKSNLIEAIVEIFRELELGRCARLRVHSCSTCAASTPSGSTPTRRGRAGGSTSRSTVSR